MNKSELLQQQLSSPAPSRTIRAVKPSVTLDSDYNVQLQRIVRQVRKDVNDRLIPVLRQSASEYTQDASWLDSLKSAFSWLAARWTSQQFDTIANSVASTFIRSADTKVSKSFAIDIFSNNQTMQEYLEASVYNNVQLIKSIPQQYLARVEEIVMANVRAGLRPAVIEKQLVQQFGITTRRAKLIARDQTAKVTSGVAEKRIRSLGYSYFRWVDAHDQRVRHRHREIANKVTAYGKGIYRWDTPPLSDKGEPIKPGTDYQCRCIAQPVPDDEVEENIKVGRVAKGVKR